MKLNVAAVLNDRSIGVLGVNYCLSLAKLGIEVSLLPIHPPQQNLVFESEEDVRILQQQMRNADFFDSEATSLRIWHPQLQHEHMGRGTRCCYSSFELTPLRKQELHHLSTVDLAFFPCEWACSVAKESGLETEVDHFPHGVNRNIFNEIGRPIRKEGEPTRFLSVGKWEHRKSHRELSQIFDAAFSETDNVELYISHFNPFCSEEEVKQWEDLYRNSKLANKIRFVNWANNPRDLAQLMRSCDCMVNYSKGEAFDLPLLEGLSTGCHVIATNYSGHTEFLTPENARLVEIDSLEVAFDGKFFVNETSQWARIGRNQIEQAINHMRNVHNLCQQGNLDINNKGIEKAEELTWIRATSILIDKLSDRGLL